MYFRNRLNSLEKHSTRGCVGDHSKVLGHTEKAQTAWLFSALNLEDLEPEHLEIRVIFRISDRYRMQVSIRLLNSLYW